MSLASRLRNAKNSRSNRRKNRAKRQDSSDGARNNSNAPSRRLKRSQRGGILPGLKSPARAERAAKLSDSKKKASNEPVTRQRSGAIVERPKDLKIPPPIKENNKPEADDGTKLWDGKTQPEFDKDFEENLIKSQPRKFDITRLRWVYRTETEPGVFEYVPLKEDAEDFEVERGIYAIVDHHKPLEELVKEQGTLRKYKAEGEDIEAFELSEIKNIIQDPNNIVIRTPRFLEKFKD